MDIILNARLYASIKSRYFLYLPERFIFAILIFTVTVTGVRSQGDTSLKEIKEKCPLGT
jgi:hypothetical protein